MKVYTYFKHVECLRDGDLLSCWRESWQRHGWETVELKEEDALRADPGRVERFKRSPLLKSCPGNPKDYTLSAMLRWIPMTKVTEPCVHVDWDVMCNGFKPDQIVNAPTDKIYFFSGSTCPCAVYGTPRAWNLMAAMLEAAPWFPRFKAEELLNDSCDQYACSVMPRDFFEIDPAFPCKCYKSDTGWESAPMIHFPTCYTPYPRSKSIRSLNILR